jgi:hypothetical protein
MQWNRLEDIRHRQTPSEMKVQAVRCKSRTLNCILLWWNFPYNKKGELSGSNSNTLNLYFGGTGFKLRFLYPSHRTNLQLGDTSFI